MLSINHFKNKRPFYEYLKFLTIRDKVYHKTVYFIFPEEFSSWKLKKNIQTKKKKQWRRKLNYLITENREPGLRSVYSFN